MSYTLILNDHNKIFNFGPSDLDEIFFLNGQSLACEARIKNKNYCFEIETLNDDPKSLAVTLNGKTYRFSIKDEIDMLIMELGLHKSTNKLSGDTYSPMPGLVLKIAVSEKENVKKGQELIILEAMKMENVLKAEGDGMITKIHVAPGDKVEKSQLLISMKENEI